MSRKRQPPDTGGTTRLRVHDEVRLAQLASGLAKQYDNFHDALQEVIDNGVSASVPDEGYFEDPMAYDPVELYIALVREGDMVWFIVADNGSGIAQDTLAETVFEVSNTEASDGILNNVGWGVKQSLAWFESKVAEDGVTTDAGEPPAFRLVTRPPDADQPYKVEGPITDDKYVEPATEEDWSFGIKDEVSNISGTDHGTRVHLPCSWEQVNNDLWGGDTTTLTKRIQAFRTRLGITFRRLLNAREENRIVLTVVDRDDPDMAAMEVHPIDLEYAHYEGEDRPVTFDITVDGVTYNIEYERGKLDFEAMAETAREADERLVTSGDKLRDGYKATKKHQGVDIYANGRVMMTGVFEELYRKQNTPDEYLSKDDVYNHFGGEVRIVPEDHTESVPTDNKKTAVDTSHRLWERLEEELHQRGGPVNTYKLDPSDGSGESTADSSDGPTSEDSDDGPSGNSDDNDNGSEDSAGSETASGGRTDGGTQVEESGDDLEDDSDDTDNEDEDEEVSVETMDASAFRRGWHNGEFDHDDLVDRLVATLRDEEMTQRVDVEKHYKGTRVDVDQILEDGQHILWEVRTSQQDRRAVYHISMYQDVFKESASPDDFRRSVLLSDGLSTDAGDALRDDDRRDVCGEPYQVSQKNILEKLG